MSENCSGESNKYVKILDDEEVIPIIDRTFDITCPECETKLQFSVRAMTYSPAWIYGEGAFYIYCKLCEYQLNVTHQIAPWIRRWLRLRCAPPKENIK